MRRCMAFCVPSKGRRHWAPCPHRAAYNSALCARHGNALRGIVYGLGEYLHTHMPGATNSSDVRQDPQTTQLQRIH